jgi:hypothetical protein
LLFWLPKFEFLVLSRARDVAELSCDAFATLISWLLAWLDLSANCPNRGSASGSPDERTPEKPEKEKKDNDKEHRFVLDVAVTTARDELHGEMVKLRADTHKACV